MNILFHFIFLVIICKIKCQQVLNEELAISTQKPGEKINLKKTQIDRRFLEDLDDEEWHVAHLRGAVLDGRRDCKTDTFADKVRRYRKMLKEDGARVEYVSSKALSVNPDDIVVEACEAKDDLSDPFVNVTMKVTSANFIEPTVVLNETSANTTKTTTVAGTTKVADATIVAGTTKVADETTVSDTKKVADMTKVTDHTIKQAETTPKMDFKATTVESKAEPKKKMGNKQQADKNDTRRASEYMFSSVEYYDESIEFDNTLCPDAVEIIELQIDQLRSYDLECEMTVEWRSLE